MPEPITRLRVEEVDWPSILPALRLFESFRMAVHPPKLLVALLLVASVYLCGWLLDSIAGRGVDPEEIQAMAGMTGREFEAYLEVREGRNRDRLLSVLRSLPNIRGGALALVDSPDRHARAVREIDRHSRDRYEEVRAEIDELAKRRDELRRLGPTRPSGAAASDGGGAGPGDAVGRGDSSGAGSSSLPPAPSDWARVQAEELGERIRRLESQARQVAADRRSMLAEVRRLRPRGVFDSLVTHEVDAFKRLVNSAMSLRLGLGDLLGQRRPAGDTVLGAMWDLFITGPTWLVRRHPIFTVIGGLAVFALWALLGGAITRMAAVHAARGASAVSAAEAMSFARRRWGWFVLAPVAPPLGVLLLGLIPLLLGLIAFNFPVLDVVGGLLFGLALVAGLAMSLLLLVYAGAVHLFHPALAVEGHDAFDALSRSFAYVGQRVWRFLAYIAVALVYGAVCYLFVGLIAFLTLWLTQRFVALGVVREAGLGVDRFEAIMSAPTLGELAYDVDLSLLSWPGKVAGVLVAVWSYALVGLVAAFAVSFYCCATTMIYLLLRRSADGVELSEIAADRRAAMPGASAEAPVPGAATGTTAAPAVDPLASDASPAPITLGQTPPPPPTDDT